MLTTSSPLVMLTLRNQPHEDFYRRLSFKYGD